MGIAPAERDLAGQSGLKCCYWYYWFPCRADPKPDRLLCFSFFCNPAIKQNQSNEKSPFSMHSANGLGERFMNESRRSRTPDLRSTTSSSASVAASEKFMATLGRRMWCLSRKKYSRLLVGDVGETMPPWVGWFIGLGRSACLLGREAGESLEMLWRRNVAEDAGKDDWSEGESGGETAK